MGEIKRFELRLPLDFWKQLKKRAEANERPLHGEIMHILKRVLEREAVKGK